MTKVAALAITLAGLWAPQVVEATTRELSFDERVDAQRAIERVYYSHQIGAKAGFDEAVPRSLLEQKVEKYLEESAALEKFWSTRVTAEALERELERMASGTRMPERLLELYAALGDDGFLIRECLARPILVDRLARGFFAKDDRLGGKDGERTWDEWWIDARRDLPAAAEAVEIVEYSLPLPSSEHARMEPAVACTGSAWDNGSLDDVPDPRREHVAVWTGSRMIVWGGYAGTFLDTGGRYDPATNTWEPISKIGAPSGRNGHTAVWSGSEMIVWGGNDGTSGVKTGGRYNPSTDNWVPTSTTLAPASRSAHAAVWTGSKMVVWGGAGTGNTLNTGGQYDPISDSWTATSTVSAPLGRSGQTAVWTGTELLVWGGINGSTYLGNGGRYNPVTNSWQGIQLTNAPSPRYFHTAVWTGDRMIVWGGFDGTSYFNTGGRYNPATNTWTTTSTTNAPTARSGPTAVWTGSVMVVWGGGDPSGGRYDPVTDAWTATSTTNAPEARGSNTAVWTGTHMVIWAGQGGLQYFNNGGRYDPANDSWTPTATPGAAPRYSHAAVWTGSQMVVWGGVGGSGTPTNTGNRYDPATDSWTPTSTTNAPAGRYNPTAVWTGSRMVIWGGTVGGGPSVGYFKTGGQYDPIGDTWTATSLTNAPSGRGSHTSVWTGSVMIVWGGLIAFGNWTNTGGRYDPIADSWAPTSTSGAPSARNNPAAVWTGTQMIVWGGAAGSALNTGGRYDVASDSWTPTSTTNAPAARLEHTAVWTGSQMIVWGGIGSGGGNYLGTGGRYDAASDSWTPTSTTNAPAGRSNHTAIGTGSQMIVWGGSNSGGSLGTGGRYDSRFDSWTPTPALGAPSPRSQHTAVWTGSSMIVWGGAAGAATNSGGRYALGADDIDNDGDGLSVCQGDCDDTNATIFSAPHEIQNLRWPVVGQLAWDADNSGSGTRYDIMYGDLSNVSNLGTGQSDACLTNDVSSPQIADTSPDPAAGTGWFFLVRGDNACGKGRYETATNGSDRSTTACP